MVNSGYNANAGPGHNPPHPHPIPNTLAPITSLESIVVNLGVSNISARIGVDLILNAIRLNPTATSITIRREGSQSLFKVRKCKILDLFTIPETTRPKPNMNPTNDAIIASLTEYLFMYTYPIAPKMMQAVLTTATMLGILESDKGEEVSKLS